MTAKVENYQLVALFILREAQHYGISRVPAWIITSTISMRTGAECCSLTISHVIQAMISVPEYIFVSLL
jgi:hypothetical protein